MTKIRYTIMFMIFQLISVCVLFAQASENPERKGYLSPVFEHGKGYADTGCFNPLTRGRVGEVRAREIIEKKFREVGIEIDKWDVETPEITIEQTCSPGGKVGKQIFVLDGYNKKYNIGFEYVSAGDKNDLGGVHPDTPIEYIYDECKHEESNAWCEASSSTLKEYMDKYARKYTEFYPGVECKPALQQSYPLKELSESLRKRLIKYGEINTMIFYDPLVEVDYGDLFRREGKDKSGEGDKTGLDEMHERDREAEKRGEELLMLQVEDGIEWMKKEGLIY